MSDNTLRVGNRVYLPFDLDGELITPEQYLLYQQMKEEEEYEQYMEELDDEHNLEV